MISMAELTKDKIEDIMPCICCHNGCFPMSHHKGVACDATMEDSKHMARCALNPTTMDGGKFDIVPAKVQKKVAVVGGGVGGMEVARIATLRGHKVTIYEKTNKLGGVFIPASNMPFKERDKALLKWYKKQIEDLKIDVKYKTEITDVSNLEADEIVIATGATPKRLRLPGSEKCITAVDYLSGKEVKNNVLIVGGGLTGCEIAYDLFLKGKKPMIVESLNDLMTTSGLCLANSSYLKDFFKANKIPIYLESKLLQIGDGFVLISDKDGKSQKLKVDNIITAIGYIPNPLVEKGKNIHLVGDALKIGNLRTVVWRAWEVAEKI